MPDTDVLARDERAVLRLKSLYRRNGYMPYRMSRFEEYDFYVDNRSFLQSERVITFTDLNGKLMALRPDVTLSIVKSVAADVLTKVYYGENVYRAGEDGAFKEIMQVGLECIGPLDDGCVSEVLRLAEESLAILSPQHTLDLSHMGFITGMVRALGLTDTQNEKMLRCVRDKNQEGIRALCPAADALCALVDMYAPAEELLPQWRALSCSPETEAALDDLARVCASLRGVPLNLDISLVNDMRYYTGVIFRGFVGGVPKSVLTGGRYDNMVKKLGRDAGAIGFGVDMDALELLFREEGSAVDGRISVALPKGRLGKQAYALFAAAGYGCPEILEDNRKLVFENPAAGVRFFWVKPADVCSYVERGAADVGIVGSDVMREHGADVYELMDLGIGKCRMAVAAPKGFADDPSRALRVATKYPHTAAAYYNGRSRMIDVIRLNGSIELAPILGLSDVIVDIVETGKTLRENDLEVVAEVAPVSARLIANRASARFKNERISELCKGIAERLQKA